MNLEISKLVKLFSACILISSNSLCIEFNPDTEEFAILNANKKELNDSISAFIINGDIFTPVKDTLNSLTIDYIESNNQFSGWIFKKSNDFTITKTTANFTYEDQLYFNLTEFGKPHDIKATFDENDGIIKLETSEKFFFQVEIEKKKQQISEKKEATPVNQENQYKTSTSPVSTISLDVRTGDETTGNLNFSTTNDIGYATLDASGFISDKESQLNHINISKITNGDYKTSFEIGDFSSKSNHYLTRNYRGVGFAFYNKKEVQDNYFNDEKITGIFNPNYTAQLYQDNTLIDETQTNEVGYYEFSNTPLFLGSNRFKVKFIGEYGDTYEKEINKTISNDFAKKGEFNYSGFITRHGDTVAAEDNNVITTIANIESTYGITNTTSYTIGLTSDLTNNRVNMTNSLAHNTDNTTNTFAAIIGENEWGLNLSSRGTIYGITYNTLLTKYSDDFEFKNTEQNETTSLSANRNFKDFLGLDNINVFGNYKKYSNSKKPSIATGFSARLGKHSLRTTISSENDINKLSVNYGTNLFGYRVKLNHKNSDNDKSNEISINKRLWGYDTSLRYLQSSNHKSTLSVSATKRFDNFSLHTYMATGKSTEFGFTISTNLWFDDGIKTTSRSLRNTGTIKPRAFVDENYNNNYDNGEELLKNVKFNGTQLWKSLQTKSNGEVKLVGVRHMQPTKVSIHIEELEDFTLEPPKPQFVLAHKGGITNIDLPLQKKKTLEFNLYDSETNEPIKNTRFRLVSTKQEINGFTDSDGYFFSEEILPGKFTITIVANPRKQTKINIPMDKDIDEYYFEKLVTKTLNQPP